MLLNAGAAMGVAGKAGDISEGIILAKASLANGAALTALERLINISNKAATNG